MVTFEKTFDIYQGTLVTAGDQSCEVTSVPDDINAAAIEDSGEAVSNRTANITVTKEEESIKYELKINSGWPIKDNFEMSFWYHSFDQSVYQQFFLRISALA